MTLTALLLAGLLAAPGSAGGEKPAASPLARVEKVRPAVIPLTATASVASLLEDLRRELGEQVELHLPEGLKALRRDRGAVGIVVDGAGHLVTTASFVAAGGAIRATLAGGRSVPARPIGVDLPSDLAVLELEGESLVPPAFQADPSRLAPGDLLGILGAGPANRCLVGEARLVRMRIHPGAGRMHDFLEIKGDFHPGGAGAAVVDRSGAVVGMVTALNRGGVLAVPAATMLQVASEIVRTGAVERGWLGLTVASGPGMNLAEPGVAVMGVVAGSPAEAAGIRPGDRISSFAGQPIGEMGGFIQAVAASRPGSRVTLSGSRDGAAFTAEARIVARPAAEDLKGVVVRMSEDQTYLGASAEPLDEPEKLAPGAGSGGVRVSGVDAGSPAERAGLRAGDVILAFAGRDVRTPSELSQAVASRPPGGVAEVVVQRDEGIERLTATLGKRTAETSVSDLPRFHLAFEPREWAAWRQAMRALSGDERERSASDLKRILARHAGTLSSDTRRQVELLQYALQIARPGEGRAAASDN